VYSGRYIAPDTMSSPEDVTLYDVGLHGWKSKSGVLCLYTACSVQRNNVYTLATLTVGYIEKGISGS
jgi:hypothetical protein